MAPIRHQLLVTGAAGWCCGLPCVSTSCTTGLYHALARERMACRRCTTKAKVASTFHPEFCRGSAETSVYHGPHWWSFEASGRCSNMHGWCSSSSSCTPPTLPFLLRHRQRCSAGNCSGTRTTSSAGIASDSDSDVGGDVGGVSGGRGASSSGCGSGCSSGSSSGSFVRTVTLALAASEAQSGCKALLVS